TGADRRRGRAADRPRHGRLRRRKRASSGRLPGGPMSGEPVGHVWRVRAGMGAEYDRRHAEVWPELEDLLRGAGVRRYSIYRWGDVVFSHMEVEDYDRLVASYGDDPIAK